MYNTRNKDGSHANKINILTVGPRKIFNIGRQYWTMLLQSIKNYASLKAFK